MFAFALRRLIATIPILLVATFGVYWAASTVVDPRDNLAACSTCDQSAYDILIERYQLDKPVPVRYFNWLGDFVTGDMGEALSQGERPVSDLFFERAGNTMKMAIPAFLLLMVLGVSAGVYSALKQYSIGDYAVTTISYFGLSMPTFFFGLLLQVVFAIWLPRWTGWKPFWSSGMHTESFLQYLSSVTLPVFTLLLILLAGDSRFIRAAVLDIKSSDYIRTARAKGLSERKVITRHIFRNAMIPAVTRLVAECRRLVRRLADHRDGLLVAGSRSAAHRCHLCCRPRCRHGRDGCHRPSGGPLQSHRRPGLRLPRPKGAI